MLASEIKLRYVRFGSKADMCGAKRHVRFASESGHVRCNQGCPLFANSGHWENDLCKQKDRLTAAFPKSTSSFSSIKAAKCTSLPPSRPNAPRRCRAADRALSAHPLAPMRPHHAASWWTLYVENPRKRALIRYFVSLSPLSFRAWSLAAE